MNESALLTRDEVEAGARSLEKVLDREPTAEFVVQIEEEIERLFGMLPDDELRQIASWKMQGLTSKEIADKIGKALATVERRLRLIRSLWEDAIKQFAS